MSAPATTNDHYCLQEAVRAMKREADEAASAAAEKACQDAERRFMTDLRKRYAGEILYCYDEARQTNRFATEPPREWNAVALSFKECLAKMRPHIFQYHGEDRWSVIEHRLKSYQQASQLPTLEPEQKIVFECGGYWYCFFCVRGDDYCDTVEAYLASERQHDKEHRSSEGIDVDFF